MNLDRLVADGYLNIRVFEDHNICAVQRFLFTAGICVGLDKTGYEYRYCYETVEEAVIALATWDGPNSGHPPGNWIKRKGGGEELLGPWFDKQRETVDESNSNRPV